jgi:hypothetical protein
MSSIELKPFRALSPDFLKDFKKGKLSFILDFEGKHRKSFMVEIRNNFLDLYSLGHTVEVRSTKDGYLLIASNEFEPKKESVGPIVRAYGDKKWKIHFADIKDSEHFGKIMTAVIVEIVRHKKGEISEGVSEINHFISNRDIRKNGILIIDRQVVYPGQSESRIDLLGLKRLAKNENKLTFSVVELKNKNNPEIQKVFSQTKRYIDILYKRDVYERFRLTYEQVLKQKVELGLLRSVSGKIAPFDEITKDDIKGVVVLDNYNIKSDFKNNGLLHRALRDWNEINKDYDIKLFLKTNVLDSTFFIGKEKTEETLRKYKECNL